MTRPLTVIIPGKPDKQDRPRGANIKGHVVIYDTKESKDAKKKIAEATAAAIKEQGWKVPVDEPLSVVISAYFPFFKSWTKKELAAALSGEARPISKPDADNILKVYLDGLVEGGAMRDDALVVELHGFKYYAEEPRTIIKVDRVRNNNG